MDKIKATVKIEFENNSDEFNGEPENHAEFLKILFDSILEIIEKKHKPL